MENNLAKEIGDAFRSAGLKVGKTLNGEDLVLRCPYCGHTSSPGKRHMYVSVTPPYMFHCFKCEVSGVLNGKSLKDFKVFDGNLQLRILETNKTSNKAKTYTKKYSAKELNFGIENKRTLLSNLNYFNLRYGFKYEIKDIKYLVEKYKIIFDPLTFFKKNNIKYSDELNKKFDFSKSIGFVSSDSKFGIFRDTSGTQKIRYSNVRFNPDDMESSKIYTVGTNINLLTEKVTIVMTEGIFDIIGVKEHFYKDIDEDYIFVATCGKSFDLAVNKFVRMGFLDFDLIIYSDSDVNINMYKEIKEDSVFLKNKRITIYYNNLEKDYGIPKDRIELRKVII